MTYRRSGVDIEREGDAIRSLIKELTFKRKGWGGQAGPEGHFTGLLDFGDHYLSLCTDGVGTKIKIAEILHKFDTVGIDCIAMNANDMVCIGAEPLAFVDYIASSDPTPEVLSEIGKGLNAGAEMANLSIVGGETATLPDMVSGIDIAGTCLGSVRKDEVLDAESIAPGDVIIGLPSSGLHSNGFTLVRRIVRDADLSYISPLEEVISAPAWRSASGYDNERSVVEEWALSNGTRVLGEVLLEPTMIYVRPILSMLASVPRKGVRGIANITGGGLRNIPRLAKDLLFSIEEPLPVPPVFRLLQVLGKVEPKEMYQTFNMGLGMAIVASPETADLVQGALGPIGASPIGKVREGKGVEDRSAGVHYPGYV